MLTKTCRGAVIAICSGLTEFASAADAASTDVNGIAISKIATWGLGLMGVLAFFMVCVWGVSRLGTGLGQGNKMRIVGALSLGMREKVLLLQVGGKQLVLGVTPGRIETLCVLDVDDSLPNDTDKNKGAPGNFAQKLMQAMQPRPNV